jgi:hypothetical protein
MFTFDNHIFHILCPFSAIKIAIGAPSQGLQKPFALEKQMTMFYNLKFSKSLSVFSLTYFVVVANKLQIRCN